MAKLISAALATAAAVKAEFCGPGDNIGTWLRVGDAPVQKKPRYRWQRASGCEWKINSRDDILSAFAGKRIAFIGDSTTRLMVWEFATWAFGCADYWAETTFEAQSEWAERFERYSLNMPSGPHVYDTLANVCNDILRFDRWERVNNVFVIPGGPQPGPADIVVDWRWTTYAWEFGQELANVLSLTGPEAPDIIFGNAAFWHVRATPPSLPCDSQFQSLLCGIDLVIAGISALPPAARAKQRFVWRGLNLVEIEEGGPGLGAFNNPTLTTIDDQLTAKWVNASFAVVPVRHLTPNRSVTRRAEVLFTFEGYHPERFVYREILKELLQAGLDAMGGHPWNSDRPGAGHVPGEGAGHVPGEGAGTQPIDDATVHGDDGPHAEPTISIGSASVTGSPIASASLCASKSSSLSPGPSSTRNRAAARSPPSTASGAESCSASESTPASASGSASASLSASGSRAPTLSGAASSASPPSGTRAPIESAAATETGAAPASRSPTTAEPSPIRAQKGSKPPAGKTTNAYSGTALDGSIGGSGSGRKWTLLGADGRTMPQLSGGFSVDSSGNTGSIAVAAAIFATLLAAIFGVIRLRRAASSSDLGADGSHPSPSEDSEMAPMTRPRR